MACSMNYGTSCREHCSTISCRVRSRTCRRADLTVVVRFAGGAVLFAVIGDAVWSRLGTDMGRLNTIARAGRLAAHEQAEGAV
eukprot:5130277-Pyramimonas_sp.AAC.1